MGRVSQRLRAGKHGFDAVARRSRAERGGSTLMAAILLCEQYYYPEGWGGAELPRDVTLGLRERGYDVAVLCGSDPYIPVEGDAGIDPRTRGVRLLRVPRLLGGEARSFRLLRQAWFYLHSLRFLFLRRPPDLFMVQTNPPLIVVIVAFAAFLWRRPLVVIAQDLYPEAIVAHGALRESSPIIKVLSRLFTWSYRRAATVVSLGERMTSRLIDKGVPAQRIVVISNWATGPTDVIRGGDNRLIDEWGLRSRFVLLYSGNLGVGHEFGTVAEALRIAIDREPRITLVVIGRGGRLHELKEATTRLGLQSNVQFRDFVPASMLPASLGIADAALVTLREGFDGLIVPSKVLGYMARGLPVLYVGPEGDTSSLLERSGGGASFRNGQAGEVARWLVDASKNLAGLAEQGERGEAYYSRNLSREQGLQSYARVVGGCIGPTDRGTP